MWPESTAPDEEPPVTQLSVHSGDNVAVAAQVGGRRPPVPGLEGLFGPGRVHRTLYTDPAIFTQEMIRIFGGTWVYLAHESESRSPTPSEQTTLGMRSVIVTRDGAGKLHALFNRCTHRASTICREERGSAKRFQCPSRVGLQQRWPARVGALARGVWITVGQVHS